MRRSVITVLIMMIPAMLLVSNRIFSTQNMPVVALAAEHKLDCNGRKGYATLTADKTTCKFGEVYTVDIRFFNSGAGDNFYNPYFNRLIPYPAQLAMFNSRKKYLGDLITFPGG